MPEVPCQFPGCEYKASNDSEKIALAMFESHRMSHQVTTETQKLPPIKHPKIGQDTSDEDWTSFLTEWEHFKRVSKIKPEQFADHLYLCCEDPLARLLIREDPGAIKKGEDGLKDAIHRLAVTKVATSVRRTKLLASKQSHGQTFREFYANVKAAALECKFKVKCLKDCCNNPDTPNVVSIVDYTSNVIKDVLIAGIADSEIRKDILSTPNLDSISDKDVVALVEAKEMALAAFSGKASSSNVSDNASLQQDETLKTKLNSKGKCEKCKTEIKLFRRFQSGNINKVAFKLCLKCHKESKAGKSENNSSTAQSQNNGNTLNTFFVSTIEENKETKPSNSKEENCMDDIQPSLEESDSKEYTCSLSNFFVSTIEENKETKPSKSREENCMDDIQPFSEESGTKEYTCSLPIEENSHHKPPSIENEVVDVHELVELRGIVLDHHIFTKDGWTRAQTMPHPSLNLRLSTDRDDFGKFKVPYPRISPKQLDVVVDSGAQSCLWSRSDFLKSGFNTHDLIPVHHIMKAANSAPIQIDGATFVRLRGISKDGREIEAAVMVYISPDAHRFYLSREAMIQLEIISKDFPQVGSAEKSPTINALVAIPEPGGLTAECGCLKREAPPEKPENLPFPCIPENNSKMKSWLLNRYAASTFNKCPHQQLPEMKGPPIQIHINPDAKPVCRTKPAPVPLHFQEQVEEELNNDVLMGVLERVPYGEATTWCFKMLITRKSDGSPRRVVDLSPANKHCEREVHSSKTPFNLARSVPPGSVKSVFDAWNGYHSVTIREEDRHLTTFTTPWGLFRYKRAPQGFVSSGDGYNRRFDAIVSHIPRLQRIVDDNLLHDTNLNDHWWRVIDFVELCGKSGIVLNPEKLQFAEMTVDFAGFRIKEDSVEPLPKYLDAIRNFPTPANITDVRSWFGLVNQVAHYAQLRDMMEPFRRFLSPKVKFEWTDDLNATFEKSKSDIVEAIQAGVRIFDITKKTCLRTDWSKQGIGYFLAQKHCNCEEGSYGCCQDGWQITLAGSRFLLPAEKNYAPIEGEALAVAWALEQTKFFTMGCNNLLVIVDHKPLVKIFGDKGLDEIDNPRLFRMKRRTLMWKFDIEYQRGVKNPFADAMSRHPNKHSETASCEMMSTEDLLESSSIHSIGLEAEAFFAITWDRVKSATKNDETSKVLIQQIENGFPKSKSEVPVKIANYWDFRDSLYVADGVVLYKDRIIIPMSLRSQVIENLHSAHQGTSSMFARAQGIVFWPGMTAEIAQAREDCRTCHTNAPSQMRLPPTAPKLPTTPFELIYADFFHLKGKHYLLIGDRLSGWTEVINVKPGSNQSSGSKGLCNALRHVFSTFGVPDEISSDGGPEFTSQESIDFYNRWGIRHRLSSAYFPQSNGRAEVAVKMTKRVIEDNVSRDGKSKYCLTPAEKYS